jgi:nucleoside-diphosphate-sugar epimerase
MNLSGRHLVVFGAGYVGAAVARQAVARGLRVTALTRNAEQARVLTAEGIQAVVADLADEAWHPQIPGGADLVLNCVSAGGGGVNGYRRSYLDGMRSVLAWAAGGGGPPTTLVYTSSTSVYPQDGGVTVTEESPVGGSGPTAEVLVEAENLLLGHFNVGGVPSPRADESRGEGTPPTCSIQKRAFILRLAGIYGPGRHHLLDQLRAGATELSGRGDHRLNLIHRADIAAAIWSAFTAPPEIEGGIFNVTDDSPATKAKVVAWLATRLGVPAPRFTGEPTPGRRAIVPDRVIANGKIKRVLGWQPAYPTFREGYVGIWADLNPP